MRKRVGALILGVTCACAPKTPVRAPVTAEGGGLAVYVEAVGQEAVRLTFRLREIAAVAGLPPRVESAECGVEYEESGPVHPRAI